MYFFSENIHLNLNVYNFNELFSSLSMFLHYKKIVKDICIRKNVSNLSYLKGGVAQ